MKTYNVTFSVSKDCYEFNFDNGFIYDIEKWRCETEREINEWIAHLEQKNWWSKELEDSFIKAYIKENGGQETTN